MHSERGFCGRCSEGRGDLTDWMNGRAAAASRTLGWLISGIILAFFAMQPAKAEVEVALSRAEAPLNGPWAFKLGDNPEWASPQFDDRGWERVDLTPPPGAHDGDVGLPGYVPGWTARGHEGRWGYAWYRLHVRWNGVDGAPPVLLGPTLVDDAYEIYWNGKRLGGSADFAATPPSIHGVRPELFQMGGSGTAGEGVLAIRVYLTKQSVRAAGAGGIHVAPVLAEPVAGANHHLAQWWRTFWGYVADFVEPIALLSLALFTLSLWRFVPEDKFLPWSAGAAAAFAASRLNQPLFFWTSAENLQTLILSRFVIFNPLAIALWIMACNRLAGRPDRRIDAAAWLFGFLAGIAVLPPIESSLLRTIARLALLALSCWTSANIVRMPRFRFTAVAALLAMFVVLFSGELSKIGIPGIWFPFGVGVSLTQFALVAAIPLLALFVHLRASPIRVENTRLAEVPDGCPEQQQPAAEPGR